LAVQVGERGDRVVEEHQAEAADLRVEAADSEAVSLGVGFDELDIDNDVRWRATAGNSEDVGGYIYPDRTCTCASCVDGHCPAATADIENDVSGV